MSLVVELNRYAVVSRLFLSSASATLFGRFFRFPFAVFSRMLEGTRSPGGPSGRTRMESPPGVALAASLGGGELGRCLAAFVGEIRLKSLRGAEASIEAP